MPRAGTRSTRTKVAQHVTHRHAPSQPALPGPALIQNRVDARTGAASPPSDSIHSSDIAFKPNNDGWGGGNPAYASNYDRIFGNKNGSTKKAAPEPTAPQPAAQALDARDALALRRILRESGESSALAEILEESGWRRGG